MFFSIHGSPARLFKHIDRPNCPTRPGVGQAWTPICAVFGGRPADDAAGCAGAFRAEVAEPVCLLAAMRRTGGPIPSVCSRLFATCGSGRFSHRFSRPWLPRQRVAARDGPWIPAVGIRCGGRRLLARLAGLLEGLAGLVPAGVLSRFACCKPRFGSRALWPGCPVCGRLPVLGWGIGLCGRRLLCHGAAPMAAGLDGLAHRGPGPVRPHGRRPGTPLGSAPGSDFTSRPRDGRLRGRLVLVFNGPIYRPSCGPIWAGRAFPLGRPTEGVVRCSPLGSGRTAAAVACRYCSGTPERRACWPRLRRLKAVHWGAGGELCCARLSELEGPV